MKPAIPEVRTADQVGRWRERGSCRVTVRSWGACSLLVVWGGLWRLATLVAPLFSWTFHLSASTAGSLRGLLGLPFGRVVWNESVHGEDVARVETIKLTK